MFRLTEKPGWGGDSEQYIESTAVRSVESDPTFAAVCQKHISPGYNKEVAELPLFPSQKPFRSSSYVDSSLQVPKRFSTEKVGSSKLL